MLLVPILQSSRLVVLQDCTGASEVTSALVAELALHARVHVLDGGNRFPAYKIMRLIRKHTADVNTVAKRIIIQRAFTCYQMLSLLEGRGQDKTPCLILDLLTTFYDETIPTHEAQRVLENCLAHLERLSLSAPVMLTLSNPGNMERAFFTDLIMNYADQSITIEEPTSIVTQPVLF